jgi:hypothetical protein
VEGLEPGAVVAVDSFNRIHDGAKVAIRPSAGATPSMRILRPSAVP